MLSQPLFEGRPSRIIRWGLLGVCVSGGLWWDHLRRENAEKYGTTDAPHYRLQVEPSVKLSPGSCYEYLVNERVPSLEARLAYLHDADLEILAAKLAAIPPETAHGVRDQVSEMLRHPSSIDYLRRFQVDGSNDRAPIPAEVVARDLFARLYGQSLPDFIEINEVTGGSETGGEVPGEQVGNSDALSDRIWYRSMGSANDILTLIHEFAHQVSPLEESALFEFRNTSLPGKAQAEALAYVAELTAAYAVQDPGLRAKTIAQAEFNRHSLLCELVEQGEHPPGDHVLGMLAADAALSLYEPAQAHHIFQSQTELPAELIVRMSKLRALLGREVSLRKEIIAVILTNFEPLWAVPQ